MSWKDERVVNEFKKLFDTGDYSFGMIARTLNSTFHGLRLTRNACIGKASRMGWVMPEGKKQALIKHTMPTVQNKLYLIKSGASEAKEKPLVKSKPAKKADLPAPKIEVVANDVAKPIKPAQTPFKTHTDLLFAWRPNQCRYIYGDYQTDEIIFACEGERIKDEPEKPSCFWCDYHHRLLNVRVKVAA